MLTKQIGCPICSWLANWTSDMLITNLFVFAFVTWFSPPTSVLKWSLHVILDVRDLHLHGPSHTGQKPGHQERDGSPSRRVEGRARCVKIFLELRTNYFSKSNSNINLEIFEHERVRRISGRRQKFMSRAAFCRPVKSP